MTLAARGLTVEQMIREVVEKHGAPFTPDKPDELCDWVRSYFPGRKVKHESVRRCAQKMRQGDS